MLYELYVENIALIQKMRLPFADGMNALTGETGAGKSLVIDAVSLLLGARGSDTFIRSNEDRALVEGVFLPPFPSALQEQLPDMDTEDALVLSRELIRGGRSLARINGRTVTLARLKEIGRLLINIHGQQEHTLLLEDSRQVDLLDGFAGEACLQARQAVRQAFHALQAAEKQVEEFDTLRAEREKQMELLRYTVEEIDALSPVAGEMQTLEEEANLMAHAEQLYDLMMGGHRALYGGSGAVERLNEAVAALQHAAALDPALQALEQRVSSLYYEVEDSANEMAAYRDRLNLDAYRLEEVENRLSQLRRLCKRYGGSEDALLQAWQDAKDEYARLEEISLSGELYEQQLAAAKDFYEEKAAALTALRAKAALRLGETVSKELHLLAMPQAQFRVDLLPGEASAKGSEKVLFMICPNVGEVFEPVSKIASGGELSRILLGLKVILAQLDAVPTMIFDEIDTGMSGRALVSVAERLAMVGRFAQTMVVSHAAVVAAAAGNHIFIEKHEENGRTVAACHTLTEEDRVEEIARMIAGDKAGETTLQQAKEMMQQMQCV